MRAKLKRAPDRVAVGEVCARERVRHHGRPFGPGPVVARPEEPAARGPNAEQREIRGRHRGDPHLPGLGAAPHAQVCRVDRGDLVEDARVTQGREGGIQRDAAGAAAEEEIDPLHVEPHDVVRIPHAGRRAQQQGIHHAEHRGVDADAQPERQHDAQREQRRAQQGARSIADVTNQLHEVFLGVLASGT
ncbi:MAG: hypothetical protein A2085_06570 [Gemmatimonadetes bacterium GWC2_71_10]|nr:MAG: hypothetical protein A2085_06570 [Gemmatimonadetes bacterium GWC2_71_10]